MSVTTTVTSSENRIKAQAAVALVKEIKQARKEVRLRLAATRSELEGLSQKKKAITTTMRKLRTEIRLSVIDFEKRFGVAFAGRSKTRS
jgi:predicted  nucleic acid-binding Zn-ribbon protein